MATLKLNTADAIEFKNFHADVPVKDAPFTLAQVGEWEVGNSVEAGVIIDSAGTEKHPPILSAVDARKLAKWLNRAADELDGAAEAPKKHKKRTYYEEDDDQQYKF